MGFGGDVPGGKPGAILPISYLRRMTTMGDMAIPSGVSGRQETRALHDPGAVNAISPVKAAEAVAAESGKDSQSGSAALNQALAQVGKYVQDTHRTLDFSVDRDTDEVVVKVVDRETKQVIRQIPSEEVLVIAKRLKAATSTGVLLNEKA